MSYTDWPDFWWSNITGAHTIINRITNALLENKNVILQVPSDLPWRQTMRGSFGNEFSDRVNDKDVYVKYFDLEDNNPYNFDPGKFILENFSPSEDIKKGYREKSGKSIQIYIEDHNLLKNQVIWMKGLKGDYTEQWIRFCKGFSSVSIENGLFVLETRQKIKKVSDSNLFEYVNFDDCVSNYDLQLFNRFILDEEKDYSDTWKNYIATLAAVICGTDAEVSELFLHSMDFQTESPTIGIQRIAQDSEFNRRGEDQNSNHILWHFRNGNISEINHRIWIAQVQVLFPIIEMERIELIEKYEERIQNALMNSYVAQYGKQVIDPIDVELGTLCSMMNKRVDDTKYLLYIPDEDDRERIKFLHECRNSLAHVDCCSPEQVTFLIEKRPIPL